MKKDFNLKTSSTGFTLVEILITVLIVSLIIVVGMGFLASSIKIQKYELENQRIVDQTSYMIEYITRSLRMAVKDETGDCLCKYYDGSEEDCKDDNAGKSYIIPAIGTGGNSKIVFQSFNGNTGNLECRFFYWDSSVKQLMSKIDDEEAVPLNSDDFDITSMSFYIHEVDGGSQPRVLLFMKMEGTGADYRPKVDLQTTVSKRILDN